MTPKKFVRTHGPLREDRAGQRDVALEHEREGLHLLRRGRAEVHLSSLVWFGLVWLVRVGDCGLSVGGFGMAKHTHIYIYRDKEMSRHRHRHQSAPCASRRWSHRGIARPSPAAAADPGGSCCLFWVGGFVCICVREGRLVACVAFVLCVDLCVGSSCSVWEMEMEGKRSGSPTPAAYVYVDYAHNKRIRVVSHPRPAPPPPRR